VRRFQLHQREHGVSESTINGSVSALRFLFEVTLVRPDLSRRLVLAHRPRKLPDVLSVEEAAKVTHLGDAPKPLFAATRMLPRRKAQPGGELSPSGTQIGGLDGRNC
jgi:site-specific recombinase XerD